MKKKIITLLLFICFFTSAYSIPWEVQIEGNPVSFEVEPRIIQGQIYVPLYRFYQELGLNISFDHQKMTVTGEKSGLYIQTKIGSDTAYINGNPKQLGGVPVIISNRTMVPMNFVAQTFGYQVAMSSDLKVFYLREFITAYKDKADANSQAAGFNSMKGKPKVEVALLKMTGRKEHYLNAGSSWKELIFLSEKKDLNLEEEKLEPSRFYTNRDLYAYFILENKSEVDIDEAFNVDFVVKGNKSESVEIPGLKAGEQYVVRIDKPLKGLTLGNNIIEVFIDPEDKLNKGDSQDYFYRIFYAYSTR